MRGGSFFSPLREMGSCWNRCQTNHKKQRRERREKSIVSRLWYGRGFAGSHRDVLCETESQARVACSCVSDGASQP